MKKIIILWFLAVLFLTGLNGCCTQIRPRKVVFTPELDLAIKEQIAKHGFKSPFVLLVGDNGRMLAMGIDGKTFTPCRAPRPDEVQGMDANEVTKGKKPTRENKKEREALSDVPICEGMKDIKGIFPVESIAIMRVKKNSIHDVVGNPRGGLEERCFPEPGEDPSVCN